MALEGLSVLDEQAADLVLCDLFMASREGLETIRDLRCHHPSARIIAMSGGSTRVPGDYLVLAERLGACMSLREPLDLHPQTVLEPVAEALTRPQAGDVANP